MKIISRVNLKKQWKKEEKKILPEIKKILRSGDYVGSNVITKLEKKLARYNNPKYPKSAATTKNLPSIFDCCLSIFLIWICIEFTMST